MKSVEFNDRFEITENPCHRGTFRIYDYNKCEHIGLVFDRISEAIKWLESKGFVRTAEEE